MTLLDSETERRACEIAEKFARYLNSHSGRNVLENLDEGESFILQTSEATMRVTKVGGRAEVVLLHQAAQA